MGEVLNIYKNFKNGLEIKESKFKNDVSAKGVATIELFDKDNNLVEKAISNNFINNIYDGAYIYKIMSRMIEGKTYSKTKIVDIVPFGQIQLRNGDFEEDKNTMFMRGDVVGWAEGTVSDSGADTLKGSYNANESFEEYTKDGYYHAHMVYDFEVSKANGTINHVYWTPKLRTSNYLAEACLVNISINPTSTPDSSILIQKTGKVYFDAKNRLINNRNSKYYEVKNKYMYLQGLEDIEIDENSPIDFIPQNLRVDNDNYIKYTGSYIQGNLSTRKCEINLELIDSKTDEVKKSIKLNPIEDCEGIKKYSNIATSSSVYIKPNNVILCTDTGNVYIDLSFYTGSSLLPSVDSNGVITEKSKTSEDYCLVYNVFNECYTLKADPENYLSFYLSQNLLQSAALKKDINKYYLLRLNNINTGIKILNEEDFTVESVDISNYYAGSNSMYKEYLNCGCGMDFETCTAIAYDTNNNYATLNRFLPYTAHTKLPSPITKTDTDTMKISYDYYIQIPNLFAPKGSEFNWK